MSATSLKVTSAPPQNVDVLIIGAGISGIGAACHLRDKSPGRSFTILESRDSIGGTWDLFRYPGIRSDSDMFTLGFSFRPWKEAKAIADGPSILNYLHETVRDHDVEESIHFGYRAVRADWSSAEAQWTVEAQRTDTGDSVQITCSFLFACTGYFRYDQGYTPEFEGIERFGGQVIHPQHWPEDLDYTGKRVVIVGSGATAVTLVPAMAERAAHVTMLQRSPSYVVSLPARDAIADFLRRALPAKTAYAIVRWKNVLLMMTSYKLSRRFPNFMRKVFRKGVERNLPEGYDVETHFTPTYNPWTQRVCLVPDGDLFKALSDGSASVVTDHIESFGERGIKLVSGTELEADIIVTATGLNMLGLGGLEIAVDGKEIHLPDTVAYKGMMLCGVPNMAYTLGYTNASWTLKCDLVSAYVCRVLNHMTANGYRQATPREPDASLARSPMIDNLTSGYIQRAIADFPKQGPTVPWRLHQNYARDILLLKRGTLEDDSMEFSSPGSAVVAAEPVAA
jgi:monooxygenase